MKTENLLKALTIVKPGLGTKELIEQSTAFAFKDDRVVTYNDEISISHPVEDLNITGAIKAEELYQFLSKVTTDEIDIKINEDETELIVKAGKSKASFTLQNEIKLDLSQLEGKKKWKDLPDEFISALTFVSFCCSKDASTPALTCVHITPDRMEATDRYRVVRYPVESSIDLLLPAEAIPVIKSINPSKICVDKQWVHFKNADETILSCRVFSAEFPIVKQFFDIDGVDLKFPAKLTEILERAAVFAKRDYLYDEAVIITLSEKQITVQATCDSAKFEESTVMKYNGKELTFKIIPHLLRDILKEEATITLAAEKIKFQTDKWEYIAVLSKVEKKK